jgi:hypothetical protein
MMGSDRLQSVADRRDLASTDCRERIVRSTDEGRGTAVRWIDRVAETARGRGRGRRRMGTATAEAKAKGSSRQAHRTASRAAKQRIEREDGS